MRDIISGEKVKTTDCYAVLNFEVASFSSFQDIPKNHFVTVAVDIDDSIKRKRIRLKIYCVSLKIQITSKPTDIQ